MNDQNTSNKTSQQDLILYPVRRKMLPGFAGAMMFVLLGIWMLFSGKPWQAGMGIVAIGFFGSGSLIYLSSLLHLYPVLVANEEEIRQSGPFWSIFVAWEEITAILSSQRHSAFLNVYLSEAGKETFSARYPQRWRVSRLFGDLPVISLPPFLLPIPAQQVKEMLRESYQKQIEAYHIIMD